MITWDTATAIALVVGLALWLVCHISIAVALLRRLDARWSLALMFFPPTLWLAPYWAIRHRLWVRVGLWFACGVVYVWALVRALN